MEASPNSVQMNNSGSSSSSITALVPGGVVTTQNISTVIKPKENNNSMQFVKIQTPELSKKAVEQIRVAQESKITKDKIKEVEEEWQSNLLNWKSKRRQQFVGVHPSKDDQDLEEQNNNDANNENGRKIKTFAEMIEQRAKTGNRLNFHLERYIGSSEDDNPEENDDDDNPDETDSGEKNGVKFHSQEDAEEEREREREQEQELDDEDDYEEQYSERQPINSTFIKGVEQPPTPPSIHRDAAIKPAQDELPAKRQVSLGDIARFDSVGEEDEDEDDDGEKQEDEEEEEQKQLQRISFVQKLKAFEKMTRPSLQEPRFVPTRTIKPPPPQPLHQPALAKPLPEAFQPPPATTIASPPKTRLPSVSVAQPPPRPRSKLQHRAETTRVSPVPPPPPPPQPHPPSQTIIRVVEPKLDLPSPILAPPVAPLSPPRRQEQLAPLSPSRRQEQPAQLSTPQRQKRQVPLPAPQRQEPPASLSPPQRQKQQAPLSPPQRQKQQAPQTQQPVIREQLSQQQSQDRTVLSVSGKKRCSSCKEELGRGAAAFVIESLNLVYHTNCFRCSVCHVNLSNGFRGVDVRVHAGALHCQNCYSKDGLNYSRV